MQVKICRGPVCTARGGGCALASIFQGLAGDHEVTTAACMHRCAHGPNVKVGQNTANFVSATRDECSRVLEEAHSNEACAAN